MTNQQLFVVIILIICALGGVFFWGKAAQREKENKMLKEKDRSLLEKDQTISEMSKELNQLRITMTNIQRPNNGLI